MPPLAPSVAQALSEMGWSSGDAALREAAPVIARGHSLVYFAPPSPAWAAPVFGGVLSRSPGDRKPVLGLVSEPAVEECGRVAGTVAASSGGRVLGSRSPRRLSRDVESGSVDLVLTSPDVVDQLVRSSELKLDSVAGVLLLWPESWGDDADTAAFLQEVPKDAPRILVSADREASAPLIERYCWRAPVVDLLGPVLDDEGPGVKAAATPWRARAESVADLVDQLDAGSVALWTMDLSERHAMERSLAAVGVRAEITNRVPAPADLVVAVDLPDPLTLRELARVGDLLLLVPPGASSYVEWLTAKRAPVHLRGPLERARTRAAREREVLREMLERPDGVARESYLAVAPLLERHDAASLAAALYQLWTRSSETAPPRPVAETGAGSTRLWVGIGRRDSVTPHDLVGTLVKECGVPRDAVGRIEIRETFSLVELKPGVDPEDTAERLRGKTIRRRRLAARLDRGARRPLA